MMLELLFAAVLCGQAQAPAAPDVLSHRIELAKAPEAFTRLNAELRKAGVLRADFSEEKRIVGMKIPLRSAGSLVFSGAHGLYRKATTPRELELVVTRKGIEQRTASGVERFDLQKQPAAKVFVDAFLLVFSGDEAGLAREFELYFDGTFESWTLGLAPRREPLSKAIAHIVVRGERGVLREIVVTEKQGGVTTTLWSNVVLAQPLTAEEERRWFGARE
jgi:hypothetical protein